MQVDNKVKTGGIKMKTKNVKLKNDKKKYCLVDVLGNVIKVRKGKFSEKEIKFFEKQYNLKLEQYQKLRRN
jgi:hypothetical protein